MAKSIRKIQIHRYENHIALSFQHDDNAWSPTIYIDCNQATLLAEMLLSARSDISEKPFADSLFNTVYI